MKNLISASVSFIVAFGFGIALGRYSAPKTENTTDKTVVSHDDKQSHTVTTIVTEKQPDGTEKTTTTIDRTDVVSKDKKKDETSKTVVVPKRSTVNVSALAAYDWMRPGQVQYGLSVTKEVLGPVTVGAWGLSNGTAGVSLGVNF